VCANHGARFVGLGELLHPLVQDIRERVRLDGLPGESLAEAVSDQRVEPRDPARHLRRDRDLVQAVRRRDTGATCGEQPGQPKRR
jgi:hypothetical protein